MDNDINIENIEYTIEINEQPSFVVELNEQGPQGLTGPQGPKGEIGNGVSDVTKISTVGLIDTYRMAFTDGTYFDYLVTNGRDGTGAVTDVTVNGVSVLDGSVAKVLVPTDNAQLKNGAGYITGITSSDVTTALGYTPYNSSNPNGYTSNVGTVTSVNNTQPDNNGNVKLTVLTRNIGEIVSSTLPLTDAGLHLLDGSRLSGDGIYKEFVEYIADLYDNSAKVSNVTKVGSLTDNNGVLSGFSTSNYAQIPITFSPNAKNWDIVFKGKFTTTSTANNIVSGYNNQYIAFYINTSGNLKCSIGNGSSWVINDLTGTTTLLANTDYWYKLTFNGTNYIMYTSTDGETWTQEASSTNSVNINGATLNIGVPRLLENNYWSGTIDLNESYININGQRWWTGVNPSWATNEPQWQQSVTQYGVCGKFVYDSVNNTVRLPKVTGIIEGTVDVSALGDLVGAGLPSLPQHTHNYTRFPQGSIWLTRYQYTGGSYPGESGWGYDTIQSGGASTVAGGLYGKSSTVQPQTIKAFYYIVIATSSKTDIQVDIDEVVTDLNDKADTDLTNVTDTGYIKMAGASMPSNTYVDLTLGASGATYTAPADGWITFRFEATAAGAWMYAEVTEMKITKQQSAYGANYQIGTTFPVLKGQTLTLMYSNINTTPLVFRFIYAQGSESEAS